MNDDKRKELKRVNKNKDLTRTSETTNDTDEKIVLGIDDWYKKEKEKHNTTPNPYLSSNENSSDTAEYEDFSDFLSEEEYYDYDDDEQISSDERVRKNVIIGTLIVTGITLLSGLGFIGYRILDRSKPEESVQEKIALPFNDAYSEYEYGDEVILKKENFVHMQSLNAEIQKTLKMDSELMSNKNKYEYDKNTGMVITRNKKYLEPGKYSINFSFQNNKTKYNDTLNIYVKDTKAPVFRHAPSKIYVSEGARVTLKDYFDADDLSDVILKTRGRNFSTAEKGKYNMTVVAEDESGNKKTHYTKVIVCDEEDILDNIELTKTLKGETPISSEMKQKIQKKKIEKEKEEAEKKLEEEKKKQEEEQKRKEEEEQKKQEELMNRTGWEGLQYYKQGTMLTGYQQVDNYWYYFDLITGQRVSGWNYVNGNKFYFYEDGKQAFNTFIKDKNGDSYFISANGTHVTGWQIINNKTYYFYPDGKQVFGEVEIEGSMHSFDPITGEWRA